MQQLIDILFSWLKAFFNALYDLFLDAFVFVVNLLLGLVAFLIRLLASIFPSMSIGADLVDQFPTPHQAICWLNWIFPVDVIVACLVFFVSIYSFKILYGVILRLVKLIA